jgi:hypothetical protein
MGWEGKPGWSKPEDLPYLSTTFSFRVKGVKCNRNSAYISNSLFPEAVTTKLFSTK